MSENVVEFPGSSPKRKTAIAISGEIDEQRRWKPRRPYTRRKRPVFRSYSLIVESSDDDLIRDVGLDVEKARTKLRLLQERLKGVREQSAAQIKLLTAADTKLSAAIVAALLAGQR
jgi:hypothetical protein